MGSAPKPPDPITPGEAAQAAVGTAGAGEMMSIANQPIEQYANLYTANQLGPAETQTQGALANQAALLSAQGQMDIQSRVDPQAYAQRQMRMQAANTRLGQLYGQDPTAFSFRAPGAYQTLGTQNVAPLATIAAGSGDIAQSLATGSVDKSGANPSLQLGTVKAQPMTGMTSYLG